MQYEKVYIQKTRLGSVIKETVADFDIYCAYMPLSCLWRQKSLQSAIGWTNTETMSTYPMGVENESLHDGRKVLLQG